MNKLLYCAALMVATTACGPALHPFYTSSDLYEDAALEGRWTNNEDTFDYCVRPRIRNCGTRPTPTAGRHYLTNLVSVSLRNSTAPWSP